MFWTSALTNKKEHYNFTAVTTFSAATRAANFQEGRNSELQSHVL